MKHLLKILTLVLACLAPAVPAGARDFNDKVQNLPYADMRRMHLGFSVGVFAADLAFTHNGFVADGDEVWRIEQPDCQPGFTVNGLLDWRWNDYFSLRFTPGMYFGSRNVTMREYYSGRQEKQNIKSTFVVLPVDIKFAAMRYHNARPYITGGVMPAFDVAKKKNDIIKLKSSDLYLSVGFGCDFYLPYFKFNPEIKFCFGLSDMLRHDRPDLTDNPADFKYTQSLKRVTSKMVVLTFYFE